ncbi:tumor necrosis factor ligand superfamily member 18 [Hemibagrus wyckioides]|uniref:tumor necrosis factor ligand superfamily member 18 n=1 Tax=Hemibagrus wyckioides TaxID=337641 RepID=UPI00266C0FFF|nr:tumor necrosis factor ligand superfamily member 18 [Hemibagrus wyckioides]
MCESGKQCYEGESCVARVDQLKKHIWALMIWVSILSLGLGVSITLHFISDQRLSTPTDDTRSQLSTYILAKDKQNTTHLVWQRKNDEKEDTVIRIEEDGNYFLFLKVTLQSRKQGENYTVTVQKQPEGNSASDIIVGHINGTEYSTGFMGIGVYLTENTRLNITCSPLQKLDVHNTYLGLIKF